MTDRDALLAAIAANPDEDTPRLVYADWLQENDQLEQAEFIRVQCRLEHVSRHTAEGKRLAKREKELQPKLFGHLNALGFVSVTFRRGFVGTVTSGLLNFRDRAANLRPENAPAFALVLEEDEQDTEFNESDYDGYADAVYELGQCPEMRRCVSLDLPCLGIQPGGAILESTTLTNLRRLNFPDNETGPNVECVASPTFANLRWANFYNSDSALDCPSIVPLAECPHLANLEHLDFGACEQWDEGAVAVAGAKQWNRLRYLNVSVSTFTTGGVAKLFATRHLPALTDLDHSHTFNSPTQWGVEGNGDPFIPAIIDSPLFARLSRLHLRGNGITDEGVKALTASPREVKLELLDLSGNPIDAAGKRALHKRFGNGVCVFGRDRP